jgi:hypothetical protein
LDLSFKISLSLKNRGRLDFGVRRLSAVVGKWDVDTSDERGDRQTRDETMRRVGWGLVT